MSESFSQFADRMVADGRKPREPVTVHQTHPAPQAVAISHQDYDSYPWFIGDCLG